MNYSIFALSLTVLSISNAQSSTLKKGSEDSPETKCLSAMSKITGQNYQEYSYAEGKKIGLAIIQQQGSYIEGGKMIPAKMSIRNEDGGVLSIDSTGTGCNKGESDKNKKSTLLAKQAFDQIHQSKMGEVPKPAPKNGKAYTDDETVEYIKQTVIHEYEQKKWVKALVSLLETCKNTRYIEAFGLDQFTAPAKTDSTTTPKAAKKAE